MYIKDFIVKLLNFLSFFDIYAFFRRIITKSHVVIIFYHRICPKGNNVIYDYLEPESFKKQVDFLNRHYRFIALDELTETISQKRALPKKAIVLTLDDGYRDNYIYAYPILKQYKVPATIFLTTKNIGMRDPIWWDKVGNAIYQASKKQLSSGELGSYSINTIPQKIYARNSVINKLKKMSWEKRSKCVEEIVDFCKVNDFSLTNQQYMLNWDEINEMKENGISFGAHTVTHPDLTEIDFTQAKDEISQSKRAIEKRLGVKVTHFSYPYGAYNEALIEFLKQSGFSCAVTTLPSKPISRKENVYALNRISPMEDFSKFKALISGFWGDLPRGLKDTGKSFL